jgi:hypothetical protein
MTIKTPLMEDSIFSMGEQSETISLPPFTSKNRKVPTVKGKFPVQIL